MSGNYEVSDKPQVAMLPLAKITTEGAQTRASLRQSWVDELEDLIRKGHELEPGLVIQEGETYWLACGHHRRKAYEQAGRCEMPVYLRPGTKWDAIRHGIEDNHRHKGERLTSADKRKAIEIILAEDPSLSDRFIADLCSASHTTVATCRKELESAGKIRQATERTGADGRTRKVAQHDEEHCSCGGRWESSGEGWRFCLRCQTRHPEDGKFVESDDGQQCQTMKAGLPQGQENRGEDNMPFVTLPTAAKPEPKNDPQSDNPETPDWRHTKALAIKHAEACRRAVGDLNEIHANNPLRDEVLLHSGKMLGALKKWR